MAYHSYPIGAFEPPPAFDGGTRRELSASIASFPEELEKAVSGFSAQQYAMKTLPGVWTVAQVIHHLADADMNAILRTKSALTQDEPTILPFDEEAWAGLADACNVPPDASLRLIRGVRQRWATLLSSLHEEQWLRRFYHPEAQKHFSVGHTAALYVWHGRHHLAHISALVREKGW